MKKPDFSKPIDIRAFLQNELGQCGCSDLESVANTLTGFLGWMGEDIGTRRAYEEIFLDVGTFYLLAGILDNAGLCEHGISIREPWLTNAGKSLLDGLKTISPIAIDEATGTGYDGIEYD